MLGLFRFVLAMLVVIAHLTQGVLFFEHWGFFAVFGFYLVSGYLMTVILNETYFFRFFSFAINRALRLFPIYYLVAITSVFVLSIAPSPGTFHPAWESSQHGLLDVLANALIFPFEFYNAPFRLIPPIWSIAVELTNYLLLWLVVARNRKLAIAAFVVALAYHVISIAAGMNWGTRYSPSYAALLPFSLGACIYFYRSSVTALSFAAIRRIAIYSSVAWFANLILCGLLTKPGSRYFDLFFYINLGCLLAFISCVANSSLRTLFRKSGKVLGDMAYPIFLVHWIVGFTVSFLVLDGQRRGLPLLAVSVPPILVFSYLLAWLANRWFEPLRNKVRSNIQVSSNVDPTIDPAI